MERGTFRLPTVFKRARRLQRNQQLDTGTTDEAPSSVEQRLEAVERRLAHMEAMIEGLQDSVHRESTRRASQIAELDRNTQPDVIRRALDKDARRRGI